MKTDEKTLKLIAVVGLGLGGLFGLAGSFAPSDALRGLAWGVDGVSLVVASALLAIHWFRQEQDLVAAGFMVFAVGQGLVVSGSAMGLAASAPAFGAGAGLWAAALVLMSVPRVFPMVVRVLGMAAAALFAATALQIFSGVPLHPKSEPLPFFAYPVFVATMVGWIWTLLKRNPSDV
jgi:hypothetical protein